MEILAIIPARGGSKGIHRKNVRPLGGKPLVAYSIEHALATPSVTRVVVSTDDDEIADLADDYGADIVRRPSDISGDTASSESALLHTLDYLKTHEGYQADLVVFLQATSPLRGSDDIQNAINTVLQQDADSLFSACRLEGFVWRQDQTDLSSITYDYRDRKRRQELATDYLENGSIYIFKEWVLREQNNRLGGTVAVYEMDPLDSYQVDVPADLERVEALLAIRKHSIDHSMLNDIRLLVIDFDGVMTDNRVLVDENGVEGVWVNRGDGWGIDQLRKSDLELLVLSTEVNPVVTARCRKLKLPAIQGCDDKLSKIKELAEERSIGSRQVAFIGNDVNDLECMHWVGVPIAVADAVPEVRKAARLITRRAGGHGAVREVAEWFDESIRHRSNRPSEIADLSTLSTK